MKVAIYELDEVLNDLTKLDIDELKERGFITEKHHNELKEMKEGNYWLLEWHKGMYIKYNLEDGLRARKNEQIEIKQCSKCNEVLKTIVDSPAPEYKKGEPITYYRQYLCEKCHSVFYKTDKGLEEPEE